MASNVEDAGDLANLQLQAYNARNLQAFLRCYDESRHPFQVSGVSVNNDATSTPRVGVRLPSFEAFQISYKTVFENSPELKAVVSSRTILRSSTSSSSYAIDLEHYTGLHKPIGSSRDGSTGVSRKPQSGYILIMYHCQGGKIVGVWMAAVTEELHSDPTKQGADPKFRYLLDVAEKKEGCVMIPDQTLFWMG